MVGFFPAQDFEADPVTRGGGCDRRPEGVPAA